MKKEAPQGASFFDNSALFAEVIQTQRSGRLLFLVVAHTRNDEYDDRDHIGQDLIELRGNERDDQTQVEDHQRAEEHAAPDRAQRTPQAEDDQRDGEPADAGKALVVPHTARDGHDVDHAADGAHTAADDGGEVLIARDVDAGGVRGRGALAHAAQVQAAAGLVEVPVQRDGAGNGEVEEEAVAEEDAADHRNVLQALGEGGVLEVALEHIAHGDVAVLAHAHILADELADARAEDGQRQTGDVLIRAQRDGQEAEDQRGDAAGDEGDS